MFCEALKRYRERQGWTLQETACVLGLSYRTVWNLINRATYPQDLTMAKAVSRCPDLAREYREEPWARRKTA